MVRKKHCSLVVGFAGVLLLGSVAGLFARVAPSPAERNLPSQSAEETERVRRALIEKATAFLKSRQDDSGGWSTKQSIGITGIVVTALLQTGTPANDPVCAKGLQFIEGLINPEAGHIAGKDPRLGLQNYVTSVNVLALKAAGRDQAYRPVIRNAAEFLKKLQWDDSEGKTAKEDYFGGAGYDSKSRPDLSNTQFFLDALHEAGVPTGDPAYQKALVFVSRCQNFQSEFNDQPWAGAINDGSFIYSAAGGGSTKTSDDPKSPLTGYGSMTYAGIKSMIYCGLTKDDPRVKMALGWLRKNYTTERNPGMPPQLAERGLYYYYHTMAKTLALLQELPFLDAQGKPHDWKTDLIRTLQVKQKADGSWINANDRWMEGDPNLVTAYALLALSYCGR